MISVQHCLLYLLKFAIVGRLSRLFLGKKNQTLSMRSIPAIIGVLI